MRMHGSRLLILTALASTVATVASGQTAVVPLWPNGAPGSETWTQKESKAGQSVRNVVKPTLTIYPADAASASGAAVIIAPGGAFRILTWNSEGTEVAEWLQKRGVTGIVLKYRLSDTGSDEEFAAARLRCGNSGCGPGGGRGAGRGRRRAAGRAAGDPVCPHRFHHHAGAPAL